MWKSVVSAVFFGDICTPSGPLRRTVIDFWRMVWQERPQIIVMVANLIEGGRSKCEQYWPFSQFDRESYGPFNVTLMEEQVLPDITVRKMRIRVKACTR